MGKLVVFNNVTLDGYFTDSKGDMSWAHANSDDAEWQEFVAGNASGDGTLLMGRITYELMAGYWPTPLAMQNDPEVAERMNRLPKVVFSRTLKRSDWQNTTMLNGNLPGEVRKLKAGDGGITILGSGSIVAQLAQEGLIDEYQFVINPVVLGKGRTMFEGVERALDLTLKDERAFANGKVVLRYF